MPGTTLKERKETFFVPSSACCLECACDAEAQAAMLGHEEKTTD